MAQEMDSLGANVLVLPKSATLQEYYRADLQSETIPEEYVTQLAMAKLEGIDNVSPKLSVPVQLQDKHVHVDGHLAGKRVSGENGVERRGHRLAADRLRRLGRNDGIRRQEDA